MTREAQALSQAMKRAVRDKVDAASRETITRYETILQNLPSPVHNIHVDLKPLGKLVANAIALNQKDNETIVAKLGGELQVAINCQGDAMLHILQEHMEQQKAQNKELRDSLESSVRGMTEAITAQNKLVASMVEALKLQKPATINLPPIQPNIHVPDVQAPDVHVHSPEKKKRRVKFTHDAEGKVISAELE